MSSFTTDPGNQQQQQQPLPPVSTIIMNDSHYANFIFNQPTAAAPPTIIITDNSPTMSAQWGQQWPSTSHYHPSQSVPMPHQSVNPCQPIPHQPIHPKPMSESSSKSIKRLAQTGRAKPYSRSRFTDEEKAERRRTQNRDAKRRQRARAKEAKEKAKQLKQQQQQFNLEFDEPPSLLTSKQTDDLLALERFMTETTPTVSIKREDDILIQALMQEGLLFQDPTTTSTLIDDSQPIQMQPFQEPSIPREFLQSTSCSYEFLPLTPPETPDGGFFQDLEQIYQEEGTWMSDSSYSSHTVASSNETTPQQYYPQYQQL